MANDWIVDVLSDLKKFAAENGLVGLAGQLDEAVLIAACEISSCEAKGQELAGWEVGRTGKTDRRIAAR